MLAIKFEERSELSSPLKQKIFDLLGRLPEMQVTEAAFDDELNVIPDGSWRWSVSKKYGITGAFFKVKGIVARIIGGFSWFQPAMFPNGEEIDGEEINGFILDILDGNGKRILIPVNEPLKDMGTQIAHKALRPALQTSLTKLKAVAAGEVGKDKALEKLLPILEQQGGLAALEWQAPTTRPYDGNRYAGKATFAKLVVDAQQLVELAVQLNGAIFSQDEIDEMERKGWDTLFNPFVRSRI